MLVMFFCEKKLLELRRMKMINMEKTGDRIREYIDDNSSMKEVAEYLGVTLYSVYKWTYGQSLPTIDNLVNLADFLNVPMYNLLIVEDV